MALIRCCAALLAFALSSPAGAQEAYPQRAISVIVPFSPGTGPDLLARAFGQKLSQRWSVPVVIDNKPGASGNIGTELAAKAAPDGHTLMMTATTFALNPALSKRARYDPVTSFAPIGLLATGELVLVVTANSPTQTFAEFLAQAKSQPGKIYYASPGNGTPQHLAMELLKLNAGIDLTHVPYKDSAGALKDLAGGHVAAMVVPVHTIAPLVARGHARPLAAFGAERSHVFPEVPTLREAGVAGVTAQVWFGLLAPAATPETVVGKVNAELNAILALPDLHDALVKQGLAPAGGPPARFAELIAAELERWTQVVARAGIHAD
jgi:tripartite-type tricarboxylate transporter receptor subunit TctC